MLLRTRHTTMEYNQHAVTIGSESDDWCLLCNDIVCCWDGCGWVRPIWLGARLRRWQTHVTNLMHILCCHWIGWSFTQLLVWHCRDHLLYSLSMTCTNFLHDWFSWMDSNYVNNLYFTKLCSSYWTSDQRGAKTCATVHIIQTDFHLCGFHHTQQISKLFNTPQSNSIKQGEYNMSQSFHWLHTVT